MSLSFRIEADDAYGFKLRLMKRRVQETGTYLDQAGHIRGTTNQFAAFLV